MDGKTDEKEYERFDVAVIGGGTAGSAAAVSCARTGARTLLVESGSCLGGSASVGQVTPMMHTGLPGNEDGSSLGPEVKRRLLRLGAGGDDGFGNDGWFNPEILPFVLEEMALGSGCSLLYGAPCSGVRMEHGKIRAVTVVTAGGIREIRADVFVDCTGDALLAFMAGSPCVQGEEGTGKNQRMSLRFMLGNVDLARLDAFLRGLGCGGVLRLPFLEMACEWGDGTPLSRLFRRGVENGVLREADGVYFQAFSVPGMPGVLAFNCPEIPNLLDTLDPFAVSRGMAKGRSAILRLHAFFKRYLEGFAESFLLSVSGMPGVRESRRICGEYVLDDGDYARHAKFPDAVACTAYPMDIHGMEEASRFTPMERGEYMEIPYRSLVPRGVDNLLTAGRCISASFNVQSAVRIQPTCRATGEAAGIAAALCVQNGRTPRELDGAEVRAALLARGASFPA